MNTKRFWNNWFPKKKNEFKFELNKLNDKTRILVTTDKIVGGMNKMPLFMDNWQCCVSIDALDFDTNIIIIHMAFANTIS